VDGSSAYSAVVANRIVFTREIDAVPVVGAGSKVTITFLNDGSVESFRYDWPQYTPAGRAQATADVAEILKRVQRVAGLRTERDFIGKGDSPRALARQAPLELGDKATLQRLACGYYDPGVRAREADAPVQPGCYYHVVYMRGGESSSRAPHARGRCQPPSVSKPTGVGPRLPCLLALTARQPQMRRSVQSLRESDETMKRHRAKML
jgi:hypothetical protein